MNPTPQGGFQFSQRMLRLLPSAPSPCFVTGLGRAPPCSTYVGLKSHGSRPFPFPFDGSFLRPTRKDTYWMHLLIHVDPSYYKSMGYMAFNGGPEGLLSIAAHFEAKFSPKIKDLKN